MVGGFFLGLLWLGLVFFVELIVFLEGLGGVFGAMGGDVGLSECAPRVGAVGVELGGLPE